MPNVGRPSRDCHLCRQRRVKCDLGRPGCQRCVKYGKECPGYRDEQQLVFRNVTPGGAAAASSVSSSSTSTSAAAKQKAARKRSADSQTRGGSRSPLSGGSNDDAGLALQMFASYTVLPPSSSSAVSSSSSSGSSSEEQEYRISSLPLHWTAKSVPIALTIYSQIDFLHDAIRTTNTIEGPLLWSMHLFSRTYVVNMHQPTAICSDSEREAVQELGAYMGRTLSAVSNALQAPQGAWRDDIAGAIWMLCNYEILVGSIGRLETESPWHTHAAGLYSILKTRGKAQFITERGRKVFWPCFSMVQLDAMISNRECPPETKEWLAIIEPHANKFIGYHVAVFLFTVSRIQKRAMEIVLLSDFAAAKAEHEGMFSEMAHAEKELGMYTASRAKIMHTADDYMKSMHLATLVKAFNLLRLVTNLLTHDPDCASDLPTLYERLNFCTGRVRGAAYGILEATPRIISNLRRQKDDVFSALFEALKIVWPLTAVRLMPCTLPEQKAQAIASLTVIGNELGVRQATRRYSMVDHIPPHAKQPKAVFPFISPEGVFEAGMGVSEGMGVTGVDDMREPVLPELITCGHGMNQPVFEYADTRSAS